MLGAHDPAERLCYLGHVGTGFTDTARRQLHAELDQLAVTRPAPEHRGSGGGRARGAGAGVSPVLVGTVEYREYSGGGLRHPSWRGLRLDISAEEVTLPVEHRPSTVLPLSGDQTSPRSGCLDSKVSRRRGRRQRTGANLHVEQSRNFVSKFSPETA